MAGCVGCRVGTRRTTKDSCTCEEEDNITAKIGNPKKEGARRTREENGRKGRDCIGEKTKRSEFDNGI